MLNADFAARYTEAKSIAFSSVSGAAANQLLEDLHLIQANGFEEAPFETPAGWRPYDQEKVIQTWPSDLAFNNMCISWH